MDNLGHTAMMGLLWEKDGGFCSNSDLSQMAPKMQLAFLTTIKLSKDNLDKCPSVPWALSFPICKMKEEAHPPLRVQDIYSQTPPQLKRVSRGEVSVRAQRRLDRIIRLNKDTLG